VNEPTPEEIDLLCLLRASRVLLQRALHYPARPEVKRGIANMLTASNIMIHLQEQAQAKTND
jgi:hypothetical protein